MNLNFLRYGYVIATICFTVVGQLILKWRIQTFGTLPIQPIEKIKAILMMVLDPVVILCFIAAFLASLTWMAALTKFNLNHIYPFMSLNFVLVIFLSAWLLSEPISLVKIIGCLLIVMGSIVTAFG